MSYACSVEFVRPFNRENRIYQLFMSDYYTQNYRTYHEKTFFLDPTSFLALFAESLKPGAKILDIGCGSGRDLLWLKKLGYEVIGIERSPGLADLARKNAGCKVIEGDFEIFDFSNIQADALLFAGSLVHIEHDRLSHLVGKIANQTHAAVIYLSLKEGVGVRTAVDGRTFYLWHDKALRQLFGRLGFKVIDSSKSISHVNPKDIWLGYVLEKSQHFTYQGM
jgi:SAM-dependent methyltransferase